MMVRILLPLIFLLLFSMPNEAFSQTANLNVMTFNIRYDNPQDGVNIWKHRKDVAARIIKENNVDIAGTQEVLFSQLNDFLERLPEYGSIGVGREDGKHKGEFSSILYRKDKLKVLDSGTFWLSQRPDTVSVGWDAALERVATWAIFEEQSTGVRFFFMNTHFDHRGRVARLESAKLLIKKADEIGKGLPKILTGDFNASPASNIIQTITDADNPLHFTDSRQAADKVSGEEGTFHDFKDDTKLDGNKRIDFIFVKGDVDVNSYRSFPRKLNNVFLSDHIPVMAHIVVGKSD